MTSNKNGSSILLALILAATASAAILVLYAIFDTSLADLKTLQLKSSFVGFVSNLKASLQDPHTCELLLKGQPIGGGNPGDTNNQLTIGANPPYFDQHGPLRSGWESSYKEFRVTEVRLTTNRPIPSSAGPLRGLKYDKLPDILFYSYDVTLGFDIIGLSTIGRTSLATRKYAEHPDYKIDLVVNIDSGTGLIASCHGQDSMAEACELAGGAYDGSSDMNAYPQYRCHPYERCWVDQGGIRQTPQTPPNIAATPPNCPWPYNTPSWVGRLNGSDLWVCQWCNNGRWNPGFD